MTTKPSTLRAPLIAKLGEAQRTDTLQTRVGLLFHTRDRQLQLVTAHSVSTVRGAPVLGPGRPLSPEDEQAVLDLLQSQDSQSVGGLQLLPEHLLHHDRLQTMWWVPSQVRTMHLHTEKGRRAIRVRWPTLVLLARQRKLYLAALAEDCRPSLGTRLYHAPLANTYASTALCTGNAPCPLHQDLDALPLWESVVFDSAFSHANHQQVIRGSSKSRYVDPAHYWPAQDGNEDFFPEKALSPLGITLGQWPARLSGDNA